MTGYDEQEGLPIRAAENIRDLDHWAHLVEALANSWTPTNTSGTVMLGLAVNSLMHAETAAHIEKNFAIDTAYHFGYGHGPYGSPRLRKALSAFFNDHFLPTRPTQADEFVITAGLSALVDHLTWCVCNEGEGILFPQPLYPGFKNDVPTRSRGKVVPVSFERDDGSLNLDDVFDAKANVQCLERAYRKSVEDGVKIRAVMITNPHNPLGKCYPKETIIAIASFCEKHNLHYLSDEIYALSVFENKDFPTATQFQSVLAVNFHGVIKPELIHVLYGASKDFGLNGLRLGALYTRNASLRAAVMKISTFGWQSYLVQDIWARLLEDRRFLDHFISENQRRMSKHHSMLTQFLKDHGISYYKGGNATSFLWIDLRAVILGNGESESLKASSPAVDDYIAKQDLLDNTWKAKGVMLGKASTFTSEEIGWFRMTFTAPEEALKTGLERFIDGIETLKKAGAL